MNTISRIGLTLALAIVTAGAPALAQQKKKSSSSSKSKSTPSKSAKTAPAPASPLPTAKRIVFLGDSITASGQYIEFLETVLLAQTDKRYEILDLGLSSETVSGLSEPNHANGQFPRPDLHERLERVLDKTKPDLVIACYGMNCGIYHPFSEARFDKFAGGIDKLRTASEKHGAKIIHLTPPVFDPVPIKDRVLPKGLESYEKPYEGYNRVLDTYAERLVFQRDKLGWKVIDIHTPMKVALEAGRKTDPAFAFAKDGVHPNPDGHWVMTKAILDAWKVKHDFTLEDLTSPTGRLTALYNPVAQRQRVLKAAWLSECGHMRPGVKPGLPIAEAEAKAAEITTQIDEKLKQGKEAFKGVLVTPEIPSLPSAPKSTINPVPPNSPRPLPPPATSPDAPAPKSDATPVEVKPAIVMAIGVATPGGNPKALPLPPGSVPAPNPSSPLPPESAPAGSTTATAPPPPVIAAAKGAEAKAKTSSGTAVNTESPAGGTTPAPALFPGSRSPWNGFDKYEFEWNGRVATIVAPKQAASGKPWVWHGEFFGHKPDPDVALLGRGFHIVYLKLPDTLGCPATVKAWTEFHGHLTKTYKFNKEPALVGLSRGGLYCYNWAIANPDKVSCIYGDAPVCDFKSWPGGKGKAKGDPKNWTRVLELWSFKSDEEAVAAKVNPVDNLAPLAKKKVPLLHVFGDADDVVPPDENTLLLAERYRRLGGSIDLIAKAGCGHHPHGLQDSAPIVDFIARNAK